MNLLQELLYEFMKDSLSNYRTQYPEKLLQEFSEQLLDEFSREISKKLSEESPGEIPEKIQGSSCRSFRRNYWNSCKIRRGFGGTSTAISGEIPGSCG